MQSWVLMLIILVAIQVRVQQFIKGFGGIGAILEWEWKYYPPEKEEIIVNEETSEKAKPVLSDGAELDLDGFFM